MKLIHYCLLIACLICCSQIANATLIVSVPEGDFHVMATLNGTFDELETQLDDQPWWGDLGLAEVIAEAVADYFGLPNDGLAPFFATARSSGGDGIVGCAYPNFSGNVFCSDALEPTNRSFVFATGSRIPEPTTLALMGLGLAGVGWSKRRKKNN